MKEIEQGEVRDYTGARVGVGVAVGIGRGMECCVAALECQTKCATH